MAIELVESCKFDGSFAVKGVRDTRRSHTRFHAVLKGLTDTQASYAAALTFCETVFPSFDGIQGLPRQTIKIVKLSGDKALAWVDYFRTPGLPDIDNLHAMERAACFPSHESVQWYSDFTYHDSANYPTAVGTHWGAPGPSHPRVQFDVSVWRFVATMVYGGSPLTAAVRAMRNRVNAAMFSVGGVDWPQFCVRFDGPKITTEKVGVYNIYNVDWHFSVREDGWWWEVNQNNSTITHARPTSVAMAIPTGWTP